MTNSGDQGGLSQRLVDWLEHERAAAVAILRERGEPEEVRVMATIATDIEERSVSFRQEELPGHPFDYIRVLSPLIEHPPAELADERTRLMDDLLAIHDPSVWWDPLSAGKEPREQVDRQVLSPLRARYLTSLETINPDLDLAQALVRETLDLIGRRRRSITTRIALGGLRLIEGEVSVAEVLLRPITEMELGGLGQRLPYPGELSLDEPRVSTVERVVMEVTAEFDSSVANPRDRTAERVLLALQLLGHTPHGGGYAVWRSAPDWSWQMGRPLLIPQHGEWSDCGRADLHQAVTLAERIPDGVFVEPATHEQVALRRFALGAARKYRVDAAVDFVVALEATLLPDMATEIAFRFKVLGAAFISASPAERVELAKRLGNVYVGRSKIVHGGKLPKGTDLPLLVGEARNLAARALVKCLRAGWPSREQLEHALLSESDPSSVEP